MILRPDCYSGIVDLDPVQALAQEVATREVVQSVWYKPKESDSPCWS